MNSNFECFNLIVEDNCRNLKKFRKNSQTTLKIFYFHIEHYSLGMLPKISNHSPPFLIPFYFFSMFSISHSVLKSPFLHLLCQQIDFLLYCLHLELSKLNETSLYYPKTAITTVQGPRIRLSDSTREFINLSANNYLCLAV